jgi:large subunit ribosomal protein L10
MDRLQKKELVASLSETFGDVPVVIVTRNKGLTVAQVTSLRRKAREAGASFKVSKNRLTRLALNGTVYEPLGDLLTGPCAITTSKDPVAAAKIIANFAKDFDKLEIIGGAMGSTVLDANGVKTLAELHQPPSSPSSPAPRQPNSPACSELMRQKRLRNPRTA